MRVRIWGVAMLIAATVAGAPERAKAQTFGIQARADAADRMILLGVSQGIASLPPSSAQSFSYEYDAALDTYVASPLMGPTVFRAARTLGAGRLALRFSGTYFDAQKKIDPIPFRAVTQAGDRFFTAFGVDVSARVGIMSLGASYGLTDRLDLELDIPVTVVSADGSATFATCSVGSGLTGCTGTEPIDDAPVLGTTSLGALQERLGDGRFAIRSGGFDDLNARFGDGTDIGLGRVGLGAKVTLVQTDRVGLAGAVQVRFPSPSEDEFAGPDSFVITPRVIAALALSEAVHFRTEFAYDFDTELEELRAFTWNAGFSTAIEAATVDFGVGGALFDRDIRWSGPGGGFIQPGATPADADLFFRALEDTRIGDTYVNFNGGVKFRLGPAQTLNASVSFPLNPNQGFRPDAVGTIALEATF